MTDALASGLADTLMRAAQDHVAKAQQMLDQTKALVEIINNQVAAQAKQNEDMNARFKQVGERMLDVHRILNGEPDPRLPGYTVAMEERKSVPTLDPARLRALDAVRHGRLDPDANYGLPAGSSTFSPNSGTQRAPDPVGQRQLPRAVGGVSQFDPRNRPGEDHRDPGIGSKQPDRD